MPAVMRFQESRMSGNLLVRFDEGRVGRTLVSPSLLLYLVSCGCFSLGARGWKLGAGVVRVLRSAPFQII